MSCGCQGDGWPERHATAVALRLLGRGTLLDGIRVRWLGLVWRGVPEPLRWVLDNRARRAGTLLPRELPGCGCVDGIKRLVETLANASRLP